MRQVFIVLLNNCSKIKYQLSLLYFLFILSLGKPVGSVHLQLTAKYVAGEFSVKVLDIVFFSNKLMNTGELLYPKLLSVELFYTLGTLFTYYVH